jgi:hypothetical protein
MKKILHFCVTLAIVFTFQLLLSCNDTSGDDEAPTIEMVEENEVIVIPNEDPEIQQELEEKRREGIEQSRLKEKTCTEILVEFKNDIKAYKTNKNLAFLDKYQNDPIWEKCKRQPWFLDSLDKLEQEMDNQ